jgi:hypothetical protein
MVIKDLAGKVSSQKQDSAQVQQLRDKLAKLKQNTPQPAEKPVVSTPKEATPTQKPVEPAKKEDEISRLAKASLEEQKRFAERQDPTLRLREERTNKLIAKQISEMIELTTELNKRLSKLEKDKTEGERKQEILEKHNEELAKKMHVIDQRLEKFMGLYEVITNQYNPFAENAATPDQNALEALKSPEAPKSKVQLTDPLTGLAEDVDIEQGRLSSENAAKMQQLLEELERDEREKQQLDDADKVSELQAHEEEVQTSLVSEIHALLEGFEARLIAYLDDSMQSRLHDTVSRLESVLNDEISSAVHNEVSRLKETDDVVTAALKEIESLQTEASDPQAFKEVEEAVVSAVHSLDDHIKSIPPSLYFRLHDGRVLKSRDDLVAALSEMDDDTFSHHVTAQHDDFADWLELALEDEAGALIRGKGRSEKLEVLKGKA